MSRSGYSDDCDGAELNLWRGVVQSAINGKRGQAFLHEMLIALDAMPEKKLISDDLVRNGEYCAIGTVGAKRGMDMTELDPECPSQIAKAFGVSKALVQEIEFINDEESSYWRPDETPEARWTRVRKWVAKQLEPPKREHYASDQWHQKALAKWQSRQPQGKLGEQK